MDGRLEAGQAILWARRTGRRREGGEGFGRLGCRNPAYVGSPASSSDQFGIAPPGDRRHTRRAWGTSATGTCPHPSHGLGSLGAGCQCHDRAVKARPVGVHPLRPACRPPRRRPPLAPFPPHPHPPCAPQAAAAYIEEHNLQKVVEDAINATIKAKPTEPFSFMVRPPARRAPPASKRPFPWEGFSLPSLSSDGGCIAVPH